MLKALAIATLIASILALYFQFMTDAMPAWFAWISAIIGLVAAWAVAKTDRAGFQSLQSPISVGLIIVGLCALLLALTAMGSMAILTLIAVIVGLAGAWWLWSSDWAEEAPAAVPVAAAATAAATVSAAVMSEPEPAPAPKPAAVRAPEPAPAPKPKPAAKKAAAPVKKAAAPAKKVAAPAKKAAAPAKKEKFTTDAPKPKNLMSKKPAKAEIDDLKKVNGIGPVFEKLLNKNGIYTFKQLGAFTKKDVEWLSGQIDSFPDRIERKEWVKQAKALAKVKK